MTASFDPPSKEALGRAIDQRNARPVDLYLVMCSRQKASGPAMAEQLYVSERFSNDRNAAVSAGCDWMIVSGHYGLLEPQQIIAPYDLNLDDATYLRKVAWTFRLMMQLLMRIGFLGQYRIAVSARGVYHQSLVLALRFLRFRLPLAHNQSLPAQFEEWQRD
jgi:hypothetical protein